MEASRPQELPTIITTAAGLLLLVGFIVLLSWHAPNLMHAVHSFTTLMAYNTAVGLILCGLGLLGLLYKCSRGVIACAALIGSIGTLTLIDLLTPAELHTTDWFEIFLTEPPARRQPISPTTSSAFLLAATALMFARKSTGLNSLVTIIICALLIVIAIAALLGQGFGLLPNYLWLGIKLAPHTVVGLVIFSLALLYLRHQAAVDAFNKLNVFQRLITGFIFMSLLFVAIGSISMLQINRVATISEQLYTGPLQISNAALRIKLYANKLNRKLKDIAVAPALANPGEISHFIDDTTHAIRDEVIFIAQQPQHEAATHKISQQLTLWNDLLAQSNQLLISGDIESYRQLILTESQNVAVGLEESCKDIIARAQLDMRELKLEALHTREHAANLMILVMLGVLFAGFLVSWLITRSLSGQLQRLRNTMLLLAQGNTQVSIPFMDHPQDIGDMAKALKVFANHIDERNKASVQLEQQQKTLEKINNQLMQTNKELETFAYVASHDLKSPLRGIAQLSTWIEEDLAENLHSDVTKHTHMLRNRIQRMDKLLDDLLIYYRAGKTQSSLAKVDVAQLAHELFDIQNTKPGLQLTTANDLPCFTTQSTPFEQVLRNLFSNAIKHHDKEQGTIHLGCKSLGNQFYQFSVCDDGPGIPKPFQQRVFGMFQTLKPRDELEGSGMGLALIQKIVRNYGGDIWLESQGRGCCFYFTWPQVMQTEVTHA